MGLGCGLGVHLGQAAHEGVDESIEGWAGAAAAGAGERGAGVAHLAEVHDLRVAAVL